MAVVKFKTPKIRVKVNQTLPFRVRFTNVVLEAYNSTTPPPIGIAIIGYSNYIL